MNDRCATFKAPQRGRGRPGLMLIEVLVGLALLAGLGVWLLRLEAGALRQFRAARRQAQAVEHLAALLWDWSEQHARVDLPATGDLSDGLEWRRDIQPVHLAEGLIVSQVRVVVMDTSVRSGVEVYRVAWLMPEKSDK